MVVGEEVVEVGDDGIDEFDKCALLSSSSSRLPTIENELKVGTTHFVTDLFVKRTVLVASMNSDK